MEQVSANANPRQSLTSRMSRFGQQTLTIRTANPSTHPTIQQASPLSQQEPLKYPIQIPSEKQTKAVKLYRAYRWEETLARSSRQESRSAISNDGFHLNVPPASTSHSVISFVSSRHQRPPSMSDYDGFTDISSVLSFDGDESPSSAKAKVQGELVNFSGDRVKTRVRKRLGPVKKAKAALIRHLGACKNCRERKVPCSIEHHDLDNLEALFLKKEPKTPRLNQQPNSSSPSTSQTTARSIPGSQQSFSGSQQSQKGLDMSGVGSQADALFGIGGNPQLLQPESKFDNGFLDIPSPGTLQDELHVDFSPRMEICTEPSPPIILEDPYATFQDNAMFPIGVLRGHTYTCLYFGGCSASCADKEELQTHFEQKHFYFTRIDPPHRFVCASCLGFNLSQSDFCSRCGMEGSVQFWVYGHYIRTRNYDRHAPDGLDLPNNLTSPIITFDTTTYTSPNLEFQWDDTNGEDFGGGFTPGPRYTNHGRNGYGGGLDPGNNLFPFNGTEMNGNSSPRNSFTEHSSFAQNAPHCFQLALVKARQPTPWQKLIFLLLVLMVTISFGFTHDLMISKTELVLQQATGKSHTNLPLVGFLAIVTSFVTCFSFKRLSGRREQREQVLGYITRLETLAPKTIPRRRFSPHVARDTIVSLNCRQPVPEGFALGGWWS